MSSENALALGCQSLHERSAAPNFERDHADGAGPVRRPAGVASAPSNARHRIGVFALFALALALAGCGAVLPVAEPAVVTEVVGRRPEIGAIANVTVGEAAYAQFRYATKRGQRIGREVRMGVGLGRVFVPEGEFLFRSVADGAPALCTERLTYIDPLAGPHVRACFVDPSNSGVFTVMKVAPGLMWFTYQLTPPVPYTSGELDVPRPDAFRRELIYQGVAGPTLRFAYREFTGDMARPAFSQDATYDVTTLPTVVSFRSVRIEVRSIDNSGMTYRVLSGF